MTQRPRYPDSEHPESPLLDAVEAVRAESYPERSVERVKERAKRLASTQRTHDADSTRPIQRGRRRTSLAGRLVAAAAAVLAVMGGMHILSSGDPVFADVVKNVNAARSLRVDFTTVFGRTRKNKGRMFMERSRFRMEQFDGQLISIADLSAKRVLFLDRQGRVAQHDTLREETTARLTSPLDQIRTAKSDDATHIGEEFVNGRRTSVFRMSKIDLLGMSGQGEMLIWVDSETGLPAKIEIRDPDPKHRFESRFENFAWNLNLGDDLFSLAVPGGYKAGTVVKTPTPSEPASTVEHTPATPSVDGIVSRDRVPARIVWNDGDTVTALMRDPESVSAQRRQPHEIRQWNVETGRQLWSHKVGGGSCLACTADGKTLATVIGDEIQIRDAGTGEVTRTIDARINLISVAFSPDGQSLAGAVAEWGRGARTESGGVRVWNLEDGTLAYATPEEDIVTRFVRFSNDGSRLVAASGRSIRLLDARSGKLLNVIAGHDRADFSPDSRTLACVGAETAERAATVELYNVADGSLIQTLTTDAGESDSWLLWVSFSQDGRYIVSTDWNGTATVWNTSTGTRATLKHDGGVHAAAFKPDGSKLVTGCEDRTLRVWNTPDAVNPVAFRDTVMNSSGL